jgi:hypothetical protein
MGGRAGGGAGMGRGSRGGGGAVGATERGLSKQEIKSLLSEEGAIRGNDFETAVIVDNKGNVVQQYDNMDYPWGNNGTIGISANNRYVYSGSYECMIKDVIKQTDITKEKDMRCTTVQLEKTNIKLFGKKIYFFKQKKRI